MDLSDERVFPIIKDRFMSPHTPSKPPATSIHVFFGDIPDPRIDRTRKHNLLDVLTLVLCGVVCGVDSCAEIEEFGNLRIDFFKQFLDLPHGIPSHDTIGRIMGALDPGELSKAFTAWVAWLSDDLAGEVINIDGKTARGSFDRVKGKAAVHLVSAWASEAGLSLGQVAVDDKSNEITAIPRLLKMLDIRGATITIDAMGCQREIAKQIIDQGGDYMLAVKGNQEKLYQDVQKLMYEVRPAINAEYRGYYESIEKGHGRVDVRRVYCTDRIDWMSQEDRWVGLGGVVMVESERTETGKPTTKEARYYITSHPGTNAKFLGHVIRSHWAIENSQHWVLDMVFHEDASRIRNDNADQNMAIIRKTALNLLKQEKSYKASIKMKRTRAALQEPYMFKVLAAKPI